MMWTITFCKGKESTAVITLKLDTEAYGLFLTSNFYDKLQEAGYTKDDLSVDELLQKPVQKLGRQ
jgi:hypothetical protein